MLGQIKMSVRGGGEQHKIDMFVRTTKLNHIDLCLSTDLLPANKRIEQWIEMSADEAEEWAHRLLREVINARGGAR
jgi:hypothetical protein